MVGRWLMKLHYGVTSPLSVFFILHSRQMHPAYGMTTAKKFALGWRMLRNTLKIRAGTSYKTHLAMALKLLETSPDVTGDVVECGTWKGASATNLSLVCDIVGRKLKVCDSFAGLPPGEAGDREASAYQAGDYCGTLPEVKANIQRYGALHRCEFVQGWFKDTLPRLQDPVLLAFLDVDLEASLECCVRYLWPLLTDSGYIFIDEVVGLDYCALFWSEAWWRRTFNRNPPGLIGSGSGLPLGEYYLGPWAERDAHPLQHPNAGAWTRKDFSGHWTFYSGD